MRWRTFRDDRCGAGMTGAFTKIGLIPAAPDCAYDASSLAVTGRLDPTPNVAGTGAWKEALLVGRDPGGLGASDRRRRSRSNVAPEDGLDWRIRRARYDPAVWN